MATRQLDRPTLRLLAGEAPESSDAGWDAPLPTARPADRCEPWTLVSSEGAAALAAAAAEERIDFLLATVLVVERSLVEEDLRYGGLGTTLPILDRTASKARVRIALSEPMSVYLRTLEGAATAASSMRESVRIPMRLTERVAERTLERLLDARMLRSALAWERAAVLSGRTMSEWALLQALSLEPL